MLRCKLLVKETFLMVGSEMAVIFWLVMRRIVVCAYFAVNHRMKAKTGIISRAKVVLVDLPKSARRMAVFLWETLIFLLIKTFGRRAIRQQNNEVPYIDQSSCGLTRQVWTWALVNYNLINECALLA